MPRPQPAARPRSGSRAARGRRGGPDRWLGRLQYSAAAIVELEPAAFEARFNMPLVHETVRAELNARRRGTASTRRAARCPAAAPSRGGRRARAAPAPAPRARPCGPAAAPSSARRRAATPSRSTARPAGRRCAARCRCTPSASSLAVFDATLRAPETSQAADLLADWAPAAHARLLGERRPTPASRFATSRASRDAGRRRRRGRHVGAASLLVSQAALPELVARANGAVTEDGEEAPDGSDAR